MLAQFQTNIISNDGIMKISNYKICQNNKNNNKRKGDEI
jgi:hypothetical protein